MSGRCYLAFRPKTGYMTRVTPARTETVAIEGCCLSFPADSAWTVIAVEATGGGKPFGFLALWGR